MKKTLMMLAGLALISTAAADSVGVRGGVVKVFTSDGNSDASGSFGIQYAYSLDDLASVRGALDLYPSMYGGDKMGFGGEVVYLRKIPTALSANNNMNVYVGGGLGVTRVSDSGTVNGVSYSQSITGVNPTLLAGINYYINPQMSLYGELAGGVSFLSYSGSAVGVSASDSKTGGFIHPRIGLTYTIR